MRHLQVLAVVLSSMPLVAHQARADQPAPGAAKKVISFEHLRDLSTLSSRVYDFRYNIYQFEEAWRAVGQYADLLQGTQLVWRVAVLRVTRTEVVYTFSSADRTFVAVIPGPDAQLPGSLYLRYRTYPGPPSNRHFNVLGAPKTLRIGTAISLDLAKRLRRGDYIQVIADVQRIETMLDSGLLGDNLVYVSNVKYDTYSQELVRQ